MAPVLNDVERRVLGVLIEKGFTTPDQYPLTLNGLVVGCNQKSCRDPLTNFTEENVLEALDSLREKKLATLVRSAGSRTDRFRHRLGDTLEVEGREAAVIGELLLRGPQTDGELRQRASRMVPIPGLPELASCIEKLRNRGQPLVVRLGPQSRRRGVKYAHTLYPETEQPSDDDASHLDDESGDARVFSTSPVPTEAARPPEPRIEPPAWTPPSSGGGGGGGGGGVAELREEVARLKERIEELEATFVRFFR